MAHEVTTTSDAPKIWGIMAEFRDVTGVYKAAEKVRDAGFKKWDVHTPFPIHNMDEAMGLKGSKVAWIMGTAAFTGVVTAVILTYWTSGGFPIGIPWLTPFSGYPMVTAGKPYVAWEQFMPIFFELGVLFSAFGALLGMLALNKLPMWYHPLLAKDRFLRVSDDTFFIAIECSDPLYDESKTRQLLMDCGARHVELVEE